MKIAKNGINKIISAIKKTILLNFMGEPDFLCKVKHNRSL